jgi:ubiquinone/menaquinone biosynthesis C-methylase UbiE
MVGPGGKVLALDVQSQMIQRARRRAQHQGLGDRIDFHICAPNRLDVNGPVDFVLAFWVVHEVIDQKSLFIEIRSILKPGGHLLIVEPKGHVSADRFAEMIERVQQAGYKIAEGPQVKFSRSIICSPNQTAE